ncbi:MAG: hypothetical protein US50_C0056G0003 [Candidatus Nomurabacteria bacterium GW2011_GWB1_37_5]|uniref:DUF3105 domain-containing protein n=1 Tax=Candidatus Nomurabacteria bacterium GW2011_GWB1_37_5 TaxID=1618742 RepID=A0A0G0H6S9_9BACT|nr:MAG: hypothetical protein US50_C0056G0003 [Candidatus Nomurabacteria bacterium GW2011_GWB1_37_5]
MTNYSPKELYELNKKIKKVEEQKKSGERKKYTKTIIWIVIVAGIFAIILWAILRPKSEKVEPLLLDKTELGQEIQIISRDHILPNSEHEPYNSNPPTSGPHYADSPTGGFYRDGLEDERALHGLEHGYIWISYKNIDEATLEQLKDIQKRNYGSVILTPREGNDAPIALASWGRLLNLDSFDEATINTYIKLYKNQSPEKLAR